MPWYQDYNPLDSPTLSTLAAILPMVVLLGCLGLLRFKAHVSALLGLGAALLVGMFAFRMPVSLAGISALYGMAYGFLPIGWIVLNVIFLYQLANRKGLFRVVQDSLTAITRDRRLQLLMVAFCLGAFFEGAAGFGTPVAVAASILIGLGFPALTASSLSLIAITAPVPYAALGTPLVALQSVTGLDLYDLSAMVGRQMAPFSLLLPFWVIWVYAGWRGMVEVLPALLVTGAAYALSSLLISNLHGPWLVNIVSALISLGALLLLLRGWQPKHTWRLEGENEGTGSQAAAYSRRQILDAWMPWIILSLMVFIWGLPPVKTWLDGATTLRFAVPGLDGMVMRVPPIVSSARPEAAIYNLNWLSATGTAILFAGIISALRMGCTGREILQTYVSAIKQTRYSLLTIVSMLSIGFVIRYAGMDAVLGLTFARSGVLYPFFGTLLGWLGVALTGSDTSSNVLFGSLQRITAEQLGLSPVMMAAANSSGGVMGKMIDAQSIVVASTATRWYGHEAEILRRVFWHSLGLGVLVALLVLLQAYVPPFTLMVVR